MCLSGFSSVAVSTMLWWLVGFFNLQFCFPGKSTSSLGNQTWVPCGNLAMERVATMLLRWSYAASIWDAWCARLLRSSGKKSSSVQPHTQPPEGARSPSSLRTFVRRSARRSSDRRRLGRRGKSRRAFSFIRPRTER